MKTWGKFAKFVLSIKLGCSDGMTNKSGKRHQKIKNPERKKKGKEKTLLVYLVYLSLSIRQMRRTIWWELALGSMSRTRNINLEPIAIQMRNDGVLELSGFCGGCENVQTPDFINSNTNHIYIWIDYKMWDGAYARLTWILSQKLATYDWVYFLIQW